MKRRIIPTVQEKNFSIKFLVQQFNSTVMEVKKNPKADLSRFSIIFFQLGLILVLASTYIGLEWKSSDRNEVVQFEVAIPDEDQEDIPISMLNTPPPPPPPPPPALPEIVQVVEDELDVEEDLIESTESSQEAKIEKIVPISAVVYEEEEEEIENVPFTVVEEIPVYPGCEKYTDKAEKKKCMTEKIDDLFKKHFDTGIGQELGIFGINRIYVVFRINEKGDVVDIQTRGPHKKLEAEAERVAKMLPKMIPGKQRGKPVSVAYALPVVFEVRERS